MTNEIVMRPLNLNEKPHFCSNCLIEASAGTGKTYSIANLFLHGVLSGRKVEEILVVTFTEDATKELTDRIRRNIHQALLVIKALKVDDSLQAILSNYDAITVTEYLENAISDMDKSAIFTIHGFCNRVLKENAFESSMAFGLELISDTSELQEEVVKDQYRKIIISKNFNMQSEDNNELSIENLKVYAKNYLSSPGKELINAQGQDLLKESLKAVEENFHNIKTRRNLLSYDDMIINLYKAVTGSKNEKLIRVIREKYSIALVDEFQDTDSYQYEIFKKVFGDSEEHGFFMIGDPKQSIYGFRGADINCYLRAKKDAKFHYTLDTNYRSERGMVEAINLFFQQRNSSDAFAYEENDNAIEFIPVKAADKSFIFKIENETSENLVFHHFGSKTEDDYYKWVVYEIRRILSLSRNGKAYFVCGNEKKSLKNGDFAVLVNTNVQAKKLQDFCLKHNLPAVIKKSGSIFATLEARDMVYWIDAIINANESSLKNFLISSFVGFRCNDLVTFDSKGYLKWNEKFVVWRKLWHEKGVTAAFYSLLSYELASAKSVKKHLASQISGERILSNFMHLCELLHEFEKNDGCSIERALHWLKQRIKDSDVDSDEYLQRLETDANAVEIMTIHKSKGLEFPIVFCPFLSQLVVKNYDAKVKTFTYSENDKHYMDISADLKSASRNENLLKLAKLDIQEKMRLAYVGLTRAVNRCYIGYGDGGKTTTASPISYLLLNHLTVDQVLALRGMSSKAKESILTANEDVNTNVNNFCKKNSELAKVSNDYNADKNEQIAIKSEAQNLLFEPEKISLKLDKWRIGSFSWLTAYAASDEMVKDYDDDFEMQQADVVEPKGIFALPKGAIFGTTIHKIFENYFSFGRNEFLKNSNLWQGVLESMPYFSSSKDSEKSERFRLVKTMIDNVLSVRLVGAAEEVILEKISKKDAKVEMEFFYKLGSINPQKLGEIFIKNGSEVYGKKLLNLNFSMDRGLMNGFIDLVLRQDGKYYIVDWKTNYLGADQKFYGKKFIDKVMLESWYFLQYHIYALALHMHLQLTIKEYDYERDFGGVFYLFVRGINLDCGQDGIYFNKPSLALLESLRKEMVEGEDGE